MDNPKDLLDLKHAAERVARGRNVALPDGFNADTPKLTPGSPAARLLLLLSRSSPRSWYESLVDHAVRDVGVKEQPAGSNSGPRIDAALRFCGIPLSWPPDRKAWCAAMVSLWLHESGYTGPWPSGKASVPSWEAMGVSRGLVVDVTRARRGDLVTFQFDADPAGDHIGLVRAPLRADGVLPTVEGNTSPDAGGSQWNGGEVCRKLRPRRQVKIVLRVPKP